MEVSFLKNLKKIERGGVKPGFHKFIYQAIKEALRIRRKLGIKSTIISIQTMFVHIRLKIHSIMQKLY